MSFSWDDDERSEDSMSVGSLVDFIEENDEVILMDSKDSAAVCEDNIIDGRRTRKKTQRWLPDDYEKTMMEDDSIPTDSDDAIFDESVAHGPTLAVLRCGPVGPVRLGNYGPFVGYEWWR